MDKIELQKYLTREFGDKFIFHPKFFEEFKALVDNSGVEEKVIEVFITKLFSILALGDIDYGIKWLEKLKEYKNLYSLHIDVRDKNFRLLFTKNRDNKYFLEMFFERSGKKKTSYASHAKIAMERMKEM